MPKSSRRSVKNNKVICAQCKLCVEEDDESIECDKCNKNFHVICTSLDKRQFDYLLNHENEEFVCHLCDNNNNTSVQVQLTAIKTELRKLDQLSTLNETMNFMSKQFDDIIKGIADNKKKVERLQKENKELKTEVKMLKDSVKYINDQRVKNDCLVTGVVVGDDVSAVDALLKLSNDAGVVMTEENISDAYFLKRKNATSDKKSVVVKCNSKKSKELLMSLKPKLRENEETKQIYVHDYLSRETMSLLNYAKSLKNLGYRGVYTIDGRVFARRSEFSKPKLIRSVEEVDKLVLEATTYRSKRQSVRDIENGHDDSDSNFVSPS